MNIAIISPYSTAPLRGNITTVSRICRYLSLQGLTVRPHSLDTTPAADIETALQLLKPQIVHGFHATRCGTTTCHLAASLGARSVVTITGSDIYDAHLREHPHTQYTMATADALVCFDQYTARELAQHFPSTQGRLHIIPQGVEILTGTGSAPDDIPPDAFVLLLPAALRPVKQVEFAIQALAPLLRQIPALLLVIAGGVIDTSYAHRIQHLLASAPHALWLGEVPRNRMADIYLRSQIVLNCSKFEEMSNSLLEAMALGRPVLAADIRGNRAVIEHERTGWLYKGAQDFRDWVCRIAADTHLGRRIGEAARQTVLDVCDPAREAAQYQQLYHDLHIHEKAEPSPT